MKIELIIKYNLIFKKILKLKTNILFKKKIININVCGDRDIRQIMLLS